MTHNSQRLAAVFSRWRGRFTTLVKTSDVLPAGLGQGAYLGGAAGKLGGMHVNFPYFVVSLLGDKKLCFASHILSFFLFVWN